MNLPTCAICQRQITGTLYVTSEAGRTVHRCEDCARPKTALQAEHDHFAATGRIRELTGGEPT